MFADIGPTTSLPLVAFAPTQPPLAVQVVAFDELQVNVVESPLSTSRSAAVRDAVGGCAFTCTVTDAFAVPSVLEQESV